MEIISIEYEIKFFFLCSLYKVSGKFWNTWDISTEEKEMTIHLLTVIRLDMQLCDLCWQRSTTLQLNLYSSCCSVNVLPTFCYTSIQTRYSWARVFKAYSICRDNDSKSIIQLQIEISSFTRYRNQIEDTQHTYTYKTITQAIKADRLNREQTVRSFFSSHS